MVWSLRRKVLVVISALLLLVVFAYLVLANRVFREDKELLIFDTNRSNTEKVADELDGSLRRIVEKMGILAQLEAGQSTTDSRRLAQSFFEQDPDLLAFQMVVPERKPTAIVRELISKRKLQSASLNEADIRSESMLPAPVADAPSAVSDIRVENRSTGKAPLYLISIPVKISQSSNQPSIYARALIDGRSWLEAFHQQQNLAVTFVVTESGRIFVHPTVQWVLERRDMSDFELVKLAKAHRHITRQVEFRAGESLFLGVYKRTALGDLTVLSITDKYTALAASRLLLEKTIILSLIIVTLVFLISLFLASSITTPVLQLVEATHEIASGHYDTPIPVRTGDEIGVLAGEFSKMAKQIKHSHAMLEEYSHDLEKKVQERTQELAQQQEVLLRTTRLAAVGEVAGKAAHEVLNPLTAMISRLEATRARLRQITRSESAALPLLNTITSEWHSEFGAHGSPAWIQSVMRPSEITPGISLLEEDLHNLRTISEQLDRLGHQLDEDLDSLLNEAHRISRIVDGMRGLSRASKIRTRVDASSLIGDCIQTSRDLLARYGISVEQEVPKAAAYVLVDNDEMRQVFSNLIKNAIDAIEARRSQSDSPGKIEIRLRKTETEARIRFRDNGVGIPASDLEKIFDIDFTTKGTAGTGLGLSICRRFVREAGGEITVVASEVGRFSEFELTLPLAEGRTDHGRT